MHSGEELSSLSPKERYWIRNFKWDIAAECKRFGPIPPLMGCDTVPRCLISIHELGRVHWPGAFAHSFKDDYKFDGNDGVWRDTERYVEMLVRWRMGMLTPDYSTFGDAHPEICRWNRFRSRIVGYHLEKRRVPKAVFELRSKPISGGHGHQATYDEQGNLITESIKAGTADYATPSPKMYAKRLSNHRKEDVKPYIRALQLDRNPVVPVDSSGSQSDFWTRNLSRPPLRVGSFTQQYLERRPATPTGELRFLFSH
jgi:hypothetical protein